MANTYSNGIAEDLIWSEISQSACAQDYLDFTRQFSAGHSQYWFKALDQAVSLFSPEDPQGLLATRRYPAAFERLLACAATAANDSDKAIVLFNLGKMAANGLGTSASAQAALEFYRQAIALGDLRSMINSASYFNGADACEDDIAMADKLYNTALANGEPLGLIHQAERITDEDDPRRFELFMQAAEMGCPAGMHRVGVVTLGGRCGQPKDEQRALTWFARSAKAGYSQASYFLGWFYERETTKDLALSVEWHRLGAAQGSRAAMRVLGIDLLSGIGAMPDEEQGCLWLNRAAVLGDAYAQFRVGHMLMTEDNTRGHLQGLQWLKLAADQGHDYAAWRIALAYRDGTIFEKNPEQAFHYCEIAARAGYPEAQGQLGLFYWYGNGVAQDYAQAYKWVNLCALQGEARGLYLLGVMTERGLGCTANPQEAFALYQQAAAKGDLDAVNLVAECYWYGECVEKDPAEAILWFKRAADQGHAKSMTDLGCILHDGDGVLTNYEESLKWFSQAAERDDPRAMYMMAIQYYNGDGVDENEELCRRWMSRSAMLDYAPAKRWIDDHLPKAPQWLEQLLEK